MLVVAVVPALRHEDERVVRSVARLFGFGSLVALTVLLATGVAMASHFSRWGDDTLNAKLALLVLAGVLIALHIARPRSRGVSVVLLVSSLLVVWLGVVLAHG